MATLTSELVLQRAGQTAVTVVASNLDNASGAIQWDATTTLPYTVVVNNTVPTTRDTQEEIDASVTGTTTPV